MGTTDKIHAAIADILETDINGCIAGSSALPDVDFDLWESQPDIDVFVYNAPELMYALNMLVMTKGFEFYEKPEEVKFGFLRKSYKNKLNLSTHKVIRDGIIVNVTYKNWKSDVMSVIKSFDMSIIMVGIDIKTKVWYDMRTGNGFVISDPNGRWSTDPKVAVPNPFREQEASMYTVPMWVRQFKRVQKYWDRGFNTIPMAQYYVDLIDEVIETGIIFHNDKNEAMFENFVDEFSEQREDMANWIKEKEACL